MATRYESGLTNLSYTSKDFNAIYTELLDLADKISPKWKPSQSNESDPGVLLLKLDAIIGDKSNYNIDKNILELFPSSVTQYPNAREIFEQCGYIMSYYKAAEVQVMLNMTSEPEGAIDEAADENELKHKDTIRLYTLGDFRMLCDEDNSIIYTIIDRNPYVTSDRETYTYTALQGKINNYTLNNDELITYTALDYNNRLYFADINVAENGIFIQDVTAEGTGSKNYNEWKKVDSVLTEPKNSRCYKFGIDKEGSRCYIEFPSDIANIIGNGIKIKYLTTNGYNGNISNNVLSKLFDDNTSSYISIADNTRFNPDLRVGEDTITLSNTNLYIRNTKPSSNGADPESIDDARMNYERVKNTFNTLVSLNDYNNFLKTSNEVANGFICDRSNDIQASTKIISFDGNLESTYSQVRSVEKDAITVDGTSVKIKAPELSAFDLRIYALKYVNPVTTTASYDLTFNLATDRLNNLKDDMSDIKSIQHDFTPLNLNDIIYIKLAYTIDARIIPYSKLDTLEQLNLEAKIRKTLLENLNSGKINFGEEIDYDKIYDLIMESDDRIKSLILDDFDYEAYIIYKDSQKGDTEQSIQIPSSLDEVTDGSNLENWMNTIKAKAILAGVTPLFEEPDTNFNYSILHNSSQFSQPAGKVNTNSEITVPIVSGKGQVTLTPNESIYVTIDNYITKETYANYCKYFYNLNKSATEDGLYELTSDDYIIFFWKENNEDEVYKYEYYIAKPSGGDDLYHVISPSFELSGSTPIPDLSTNRGLNSLYTKVIKQIEDEIIGKGHPDISRMTITYSDANDKEITISLSAAIAKCNDSTILDGSKAITIKDANKLEFNKNNNKNYKLYWLLNSTVVGAGDVAKYQLFDKNQSEYILKTGEYLFYSDADGSTFSMLGAGTKLTRTNSSSPLQVDARSYEEIMYGANNLLNDENLWYILTNQDEIFATEMLFHSIGGESIITLSIPAGSDITSVKFDNSGITTIYKNENVQAENSLQKNVSYKLEGSFYSTADCEIKDKILSSIITPESEINIYCKEADIATNRLYKIEPLLNKDIELEYSYEGKNIKLPSYNITGINWTGYSILNLNCSPDREQILYTGTYGNVNSEDIERTQSIKIKSAYNPSTKIFDSYTSSDTNIEIKADSTNKYIQSNYEIQLVGGSNIDITATDLSGAIYNNQFYSYSKEVSDESIKELDYATEIELVINEDKEAETELTIGLPPITPKTGTDTIGYLLPILTYKDYDELSIEKASISLNTLNDVELKEKGMKFLAFTAAGTNSISLHLMIKNKENDTADSKIKIFPIIPYLNESELGITSTTSGPLFEKILALDEQKKFNYAHKVDPDVLIENPWEAKSFLDSNHPYNPATICYWDYQNSDMKVTKKIK